MSAVAKTEPKTDSATRPTTELEAGRTGEDTLPVVEPGYGHFVRHLDPPDCQHADHASRHFIVGGADRRRPCGAIAVQHAVSGLRTGRKGVVALLEQDVGPGDAVVV